MRRSRANAVAIAAAVTATIAIIVVVGLNGRTTERAAAPKTPPVRAVSASPRPGTDTTTSHTTVATRVPPVVVRTANGATVSVPSPFLLMVRASASCWVQVTDSTGRPLFTATLRPGATQPIPGSEPVVMTLGYTPGVTVSVDGVSLDLHALPQTANITFQNL
jgi:cytoskeleton protein RodZ